MNPALIADAYRAGMRSLAAGVCLITSRHGEERGGMIATAVTSVSAEPPTLLVCVNRNASMFDLLGASGHFCVNVLAAHTVPLVEVFSDASRRAERFAQGEWANLASGAPLCSDAVVAFDCRVAKVVDWHSHAIFLGEVLGVHHPQAEAPPLLGPALSSAAGLGAGLRLKGPSPGTAGQGALKPCAHPPQQFDNRTDPALASLLAAPFCGTL
ncbi:flavin reductase [Pseudomonas sp. NPDC007930]|uniref:flavin reductase family protein n=1 Tax=Pseudomonas sp. NPDC007930 TaxID=3364417 RepID=UPI0036E8473E